jgi:DNA primase
VLREADYALSSPALTQLFQGTAHEKTLAAAEADMLHWGENFDVAAEFAGLISKLNEGERRQQFQTLQSKLAQGGLSNLTDPEREQYLQLLQRG